jgi:hypothetical protein
LSKLILQLRPVPQGQELKCKIIRRKEGVEKLYPQYELYIEEDDNSMVFILAARKRKKSASSHYIISTTRITSASVKDNIVGSVKYVAIETHGSLFFNVMQVQLSGNGLLTI